MKPAHWKVLAMVETALAPTEAILANEYRRQLSAQCMTVVRELAEDGWDAEKRYYFPSGTCSRKQYAAQRARFSLCEKWTEALTPCRSMSAPNLRVVRSDNTARIIAEASKLASSSLEGYCAKLTGKILREVQSESEVLGVRYLGNLDPWSWSTVLVQLTFGGKQHWKTQMIVNVSCLGKAFNQWPTRLVK